MGFISPNFDPTDNVHYNTSYIMAHMPQIMTTPEVWLFFISLAFVLLFVSVLAKEEIAKDLAAVMAAIIFLVSAIQSFAVDTVVSYGATSQCDATVGVNCTQQDFASMSQHMIYNYDLWGVFLGICFVLAVLRIYLLVLDYRKVTEQPKQNVEMSRPKEQKEKKEKEED